MKKIVLLSLLSTGLLVGCNSNPTIWNPNGQVKAPKEVWEPNGQIKSSKSIWTTSDGEKKL